MPKKTEIEIPETEPVTPERVGVIDLIRTVCLIWTLLILLLRQLDLVLGLSPFPARLLEGIQTALAAPVVLISGISCYFSRDNLKRGVLLLAAGWLVSFSTAWVTPVHPVRFGILTLLGVSCILFYFAGPVLERLPVFLSCLLFALLIAVTLPVSTGRLGLDGVFTVALPSALTGQALLTPFGLCAGGPDDFPLLPWLFVFLLGTAIGRWRDGRWGGVLTRLGDWTSPISRHALPLYLIAQPIFYGVCLLFLYL